ncbi:MAG: sialate O-acetylesterase, partial [Rubripirellula sp.]
LPFIAGQMGQFKERPWNADKHQINTIHKTLPSEVSLTGFVNSNGLTHKGDKIHFDSESYRELGRRYHTAFEAIQSTAQN